MQAFARSGGVGCSVCHSIYVACPAVRRGEEAEQARVPSRRVRGQAGQSTGGSGQRTVRCRLASDSLTLPQLRMTTPH
jgi:hypothetical protein